MAISRRDAVLGVLGSTVLPTLARSAAPGWSDVHLHLIGGQKRQFDQAAERALAHMERIGIAKAVVFPPPMARAGLFDYEDYLPALRKHPGRFSFLAGGGTLNPAIHHYSADAVTDAIRRQFVDGATRMLDAGAAGFGEIAVLHLSLVPHHAFEEVPVEHPLLLALAEVAHSRKAVIDLHLDPIPSPDSLPTPAGLKIPPNPPRLRGNIAGFERLLSQYRDARIVWAHGGSDMTGNMTPALIGRLMDAHPNLYMSLRPLPPRAARDNAFGLPVTNLLITEDGLVPAWRDLLAKHSSRFVMGGDAFFLSDTVSAEGPMTHLSKGNEPRLSAARRALSLMPPAVAKAIGTDNAARLYRL